MLQSELLTFPSVIIVITLKHISTQTRRSNNNNLGLNLGVF